MKDWQDRAASVGWPRAEVECLRALLEATSSVVLVVTADEILCQSPHAGGVMSVQLPGTVHTSTVDLMGRWALPRVRGKVGSMVSTRSSAEPPWCPAHATGCGPDANGCGVRGVAARIPCDCRRKQHELSCPIWQRETAERLERKKAPVAKATTEEPHGYRPPAPIDEKPSRKNGWKLPGQLGLPGRR